jgi:hypothetical protein
MLRQEPTTITLCILQPLEKAAFVQGRQKSNFVELQNMTLLCLNLFCTPCSLEETIAESDKNIQHRGFAGGHPPDYWFGGWQLIYGRADGIPSSLPPVVVCTMVC